MCINAKCNKPGSKRYGGACSYNCQQQHQRQTWTVGSSTPLVVERRTNKPNVQRRNGADNREIR